MDVKDLVKLMSNQNYGDSSLQAIHDILGQGPYTGEFSGMEGAGPASPSHNVHEVIDAEISKNSLMDYLMQAISQGSQKVLQFDPRTRHMPDILNALNSPTGWKYSDHVPDMMKKRAREGAYGTIGQDFDASLRGLLDEIIGRDYDIENPR